jgi:hypothetical protein
MDTRQRLEHDLKDAMRAKDSLRLEAIRSVRAAVLQREVEKGTTLGDADILGVIRGLVKQRDDSISEYDKGGRADLADSERREREVLVAYLPAAPDAALVDATVAAVVSELGASGMKDMGRVMKEVLARLGPAADGKAVSAAVKKTLGG